MPDSVLLAASLCLLVTSCLVDAGQDLTRTPKSFGTDVVEASVALVEESAIFTNDNHHWACCPDCSRPSATTRSAGGSTWTGKYALAPAYHGWLHTHTCTHHIRMCTHTYPHAELAAQQCSLLWQATGSWPKLEACLMAPHAHLHSPHTCVPTHIHMQN